MDRSMFLLAWFLALICVTGCSTVEKQVTNESLKGSDRPRAAGSTRLGRFHSAIGLRPVEMSRNTDGGLGWYFFERAEFEIADFTFRERPLPPLEEAHDPLLRWMREEGIDSRVPKRAWNGVYSQWWPFELEPRGSFVHWPGFGSILPLDPESVDLLLKTERDMGSFWYRSR